MAAVDVDSLVQVNTLIFSQQTELLGKMAQAERQLLEQKALAGRQEEALNCLAEMVEETMPIDACHELIATVKAQADAAERASAQRLAEGLAQLAEQQQLFDGVVTEEPVRRQHLLTDTPAPSAGVQQLELKLSQIVSRLAAAEDSAARHATDRSRAERAEIALARAESRLVALESAAGRVSAEAARRAEQICQQALAADRASSDEARRHVSEKVDALALQLTQAVAELAASERASSTLAEELEERAEDCGALLESSAELATKLSALEAGALAADARRLQDASEWRVEQQKMHDAIQSQNEQAEEFT